MTHGGCVARAAGRSGAVRAPVGAGSSTLTAWSSDGSVQSVARQAQTRMRGSINSFQC